MTTLPSHRLLDYVIHFVRVAFVEGRRVRGTMVMTTLPVQRTLWICYFSRILCAVNFLVRHSRALVILFMVLIELDHRESLLKGSCSDLLSHKSLLLHVLVASLVVGRRFNKLSVVCTMLLGVSLVPRRRLCQGHCSIASINVTSINVGVPVAVSDIVPIDKDQMCGLLFDALRHLLMLVGAAHQEVRLVRYTSCCSLSATKGRVTLVMVGVLMIKASSSMHLLLMLSLLIVTRRRAGSRSGSRRLSHLHVVTV